MSSVALPITEKTVVCASCDVACLLTAQVRDGRVVKIKATDIPMLQDNICMKGIYAPKAFAHPDRVLYPLKRIGERGSGKWERVGWDNALDDIAARLKKVVDQYGPEAFAVATSQWNTSVDYGMGRRFMNLLGSPNWISGVAYCVGNTASVSRMVYGWFPWPDFTQTNCIVLLGHNPKRHTWTPIYNFIRSAQERGAKLIVLDPRKSESAERADIWLPLRAGTDAAMCLGWLNVIIEENLYDRAFVENWTIGFDELTQRVSEYPLERVEKITGVDRDLIRKAARMYATTKPATIPWSHVTDQQVSSTSAIRLQCILRSITGNLDVPGGDVFYGYHPQFVNESELEGHEFLSDEQKAKQLGADKYPAFTYRGTAALAEPTERVWGLKHANLGYGSCMAVPSAVFRAMADEKPYPVKALFSLGNNTLMGFANMNLIYRAFMNQDLIVVHEHFKTPTAQLADYILPGDSWLERPHLLEGYGIFPFGEVSEQAMQPPGECRDIHYFWVQLAKRMGLEEHFPWPDVTSMLDYRLHKTGMTFDEYAHRYSIIMRDPGFRKYEKTGFATPSGKVELSCSILEDLGFDPLPYYREAPEPNEDYPLSLFVGVREDGYFQSAQRQVPELRKRFPLPFAYMHESEAKKLQLEEGDWVQIETLAGSMKAAVQIRADMPSGLVRVPHGWWFPETAEGKDNLSSAWHFADAQISCDDEEYLDLEQGVPHLKGIPCRVQKCHDPRELPRNAEV